MDENLKNFKREEERTPLDRLEGDIRYKRTFQSIKNRPELSSHDLKVANDWTPLAVRKPHREETFASAFFTRFLWASFAFFLIAVAISAFILLRGADLISSNRVAIIISGPVAIEAGQNLSLQIVINNKNSVPLENVQMVVQYPDGSFDKTDTTKPLQTVTVPLDDIPAGQSVNQVVDGLVFGEKGQQKTIKIGLQYSITGSTAVLKNEKDFTMNVNSSPLSVVVNSLSQVNAGQEFTMSATVVSNAAVPVKDVMLQVTFPQGFSFLNATPTPSVAQNDWSLGDLAPGERKTVAIKGVVSGQNTEDKIFRFAAGTQSPDDPSLIGSVYSSQVQTLTIAQPFLGVALAFGSGGQSDYVANSNDIILGIINWRNNLTTTLTDTRIKVSLLGNVYDKSSVIAEEGFFDSSRNLVLWDKTTFPDIDTLDPGKSGNVIFRLKSKPLANSFGNIIRNPVIGVSISVTGRRISEKGVPEEIQNTATGKIRVNSMVTLKSESLYQAGPFKNTGPLPPTPDQTTTYTIQWVLSNSSNDIQNMVVAATLPPYVTWAGAYSPVNENIYYDDLAGKVIWKPGDIPAGTGYQGVSPRTIYFQIALRPSVTQVNLAPNLLENISWGALDTFTGQTLQVGNMVETTTNRSDSHGAYDAEVVE